MECGANLYRIFKRGIALDVLFGTVDTIPAPPKKVLSKKLIYYIILLELKMV